MRNFNQLRTNSDLTTREFEKLRDSIVEPIRKRLQVRNFVPFREDILGGTQWKYWTATDPSKADLVYDWNEVGGGQDAINLTETVFNIPILKKEFSLTWQAILDARKEGRDIANSNAVAAAQAVMELLEQITINGWKPDGTNLEFNGLIDAAGNTDATGRSWATATNPAISVSEGIKLLQADNVFGPYTMVLNPDQNAELNAGVDGGHPVLIHSLSQLDEGDEGSRIFPQKVVTTTVPTGTGLIVPAYDHDWFEVRELEGVTMETFPETNRPKTDWIGTITNVAFPVIYQADAIFTMTGI